MHPILWWSGLALLALLPIAFVAAARGRAWLCFLGGGAAWYLASLLKEWLDLAVGKWLYAPTPGAELLTATALGLVSALTELGCVALLLWPQMRTLAAVAVGLGAGWCELGSTLYEAQQDMAHQQVAVAEIPAALGGWFLFERALTAAGHVSSRLLVFAAFRRHSLWPGLAAVVLFALVDGIAVHERIVLARGGASGAEDIGTTTYLVESVTTTFELLLAWLLLRPRPARAPAAG
jgi:hypothetical protein